MTLVVQNSSCVSSSVICRAGPSTQLVVDVLLGGVRAVLLEPTQVVDVLRYAHLFKEEK